MNTIETRVLVAVLFGIIRFVSGIAPIYVFKCFKIQNVINGKKVIDESRHKSLEHAITLVQSFGGGVLFATCFLHMMPEVYFSVEELKSYGILSRHYPHSQLIVSAGFFLVYFIEEISQWIVIKFPQEPCRKKINVSRISSRKSTSYKDNKIEPMFIITQPPDISLTESEWDEKNDKDIRDFQEGLSVDMVIDEEVQTENDLNDLKSEIVNESELEEEKELEAIVEQGITTQQQLLRCVFIILALSFHAILEGLAIGLQNSLINIWYLFTAVSVHSATILFCIGLEIYLSGSKQKTIVINMVILAIVSPSGVLIGLTISLTTDMHTKAKSYAVVFLEGLSAGTILYITFFEVLSREKTRRICRIKRAICIGSGFALMAGLECLKIS